ncbi:16S rRNA (cytidine1402-2'-O)-methyltransferase [Flavobacteriaceae bacterium MAR_2010_188]|nr:16S rRNA (cytidine1402-2'-O)-methyltransferase [Flavobacteriaceae bacterium MAR_2010_188]
MDSNGTLYLIPTFLGDNPPLSVLPPSIEMVISEIDHFIVENEKTARRFIKQICPQKPQTDLKFRVLNKFSQAEEVNSFLEPCKKGFSMGLLSEAGCPGIADPGSEAVMVAHQNKIRVIPLVGPSSIVLALMASGMNGQSFAFHGYLPIDTREKKTMLKKLERLSIENNQSQIFIETPYRNNKILEDLCSALNPMTRLCVAADLTLPSEFIKTMPISEWRGMKIDLHKRPSIFIIHKD